MQHKIRVELYRTTFGVAAINVRRIAALDLALHGRQLILFEFAAGIVIPLGLGLFCLVRGQAAWQLPFGWYLIGIALNYVPLLVHALILVSRERVVRETEAELREEAAGYGIKSLLLLLPGVIGALALVQALRPGGRPNES